MNASAEFNALMADLYDPGGCTRRLKLAAHRFARKMRLPYGERALKVAAIRRMESRLGRPHRF